VGNFPLFGGCQSQNLRGRVQFLGGQDDAYDPLPGRQLLSIAAKLDADHGVEIRQAKAKPIFDALEAWLHTRAAQDLGQVAAGRGAPIRLDPHGADATLSRSWQSRVGQILNFHV
jgi:hypothetical protein